MTEHAAASAHHDPHGHHHGPALPFTDAQMNELHRSDVGAGGAVIVLMSSIFSIGLVLYTIIAIVCAS